MSSKWKVSNSYAELKSLLQLARVRTCIRFLDVQQLRPIEERGILKSLLHQEVGLLMMHFGYCSTQGYAIPRPSWLIQFSEYLFSGIKYEEPPTTLFASLDREEDKMADDSILSAGPAVAFWWRSTSLDKGMQIQERDVQRHFRKWLVQVQSTESLYEADDDGTRLLVLPDIWWADTENDNPTLGVDPATDPSHPAGSLYDHTDALNAVPDGVPGQVSQSSGSLPATHTIAASTSSSRGVTASIQGPPHSNPSLHPDSTQTSTVNPPAHSTILPIVDHAWHAVVDAHSAIDAAMASTREAIESSAHTVQVLSMLLNLVQWSDNGNPFPDGKSVAPHLAQYVEKIVDTGHPAIQAEFQRLRDAGHPYSPSTFYDVDAAVTDHILYPDSGSERQSAGLDLPQLPDNAPGHLHTGSSSIQPGHIPATSHVPVGAPKETPTDVPVLLTNLGEIVRYGHVLLPTLNSDTNSDKSDSISDSRSLPDIDELEYTSVGDIPLNSYSSSDNEQVTELLTRQYPQTRDHSDSSDGLSDGLIIPVAVSDRDSGYFNDDTDDSA